MTEIEILLYMLNKANDKNVKAAILQAYIQSNGPIPNQYAEDVKAAMEEG